MAHVGHQHTNKTGMYIQLAIFRNEVHLMPPASAFDEPPGLAAHGTSKQKQLWQLIGCSIHVLPPMPPAAT
eukprot:1158483-Pelagomonas_calceolata.AAC.3